MSDVKKRRIETSRDPAVWLQWYNEMSSEEEAASDDDEMEEASFEMEENIEESDHESNTEQEVSEEEMSENEGDENLVDQYYLGKDRITKWSKIKPNAQVRTKSSNIITHLPGPKGNGRNAKSEIDCIRLFITEPIIRIITSSTNIYIARVRHLFERDRDARLTDEREISALIGILFLIGTLRSSRKNAAQLWDNSKGSGVEACYLSMSEKRFRFLLRCLRFDDVRDRRERETIDKLAAIREISELFLSNFQNNFIASEYLTIDEQLLAFRGRCSFRQYLPSKPAKYGLKVFALVDAKTAYTYNLETYVGTQPDGPYKYSNSAQDIVLRLVQPVEGTNRNITTDNWFTSIPLLRNLFVEKKLTLVGTMRKNKREIPPEFLPHKKREENSSIFGFQKNCTLVSYCPKKNKVVLLVSSMHDDDAIDPDTRETKKPDIVTFYNRTKIGVDLVDQLCQNYNVARNTNRWPMVIFYNLLNISAINALCVFKANNLETVTLRRKFIEAFAWDLIRPQIEFRSTLQRLPVELRRRARALLHLEEILPPPVLPRQQNYVGRCHICPRNRDKSSRRSCIKCYRFA